MISYAQNAEDVVLARLFADQPTGRYVDVGAGDPVKDSVTKHFYDIGWRGINIEPIPAAAEQLREVRPADVTLQIALGAEAGTTELHLVTNRQGWSTTDAELAQRYRDSAGLQVRRVPVEVRTLAEVLDEHPGRLDFVKIDVEGAEQAVIEGADWSRHRPRVVLVEATEPGAPTPTHGDWEPLLIKAGYQCALFDGLNRFYVLAEDTHAVACLAAPANVFDAFERVDVAQWRAVMEDYQVRRAAEVAYISRLEEAVRTAELGRAQDAEHQQSLRAAIDAAAKQAGKANRYIAALEHRIVELEAGHVEAGTHSAPLESRIASTTSTAAAQPDEPD